MSHCKQNRNPQSARRTFIPTVVSISNAGDCRARQVRLFRPWFQCPTRGTAGRAPSSFIPTVVSNSRVGAARCAKCKYSDRGFNFQRFSIGELRRRMSFRRQNASPDAAADREEEEAPAVEGNGARTARRDAGGTARSDRQACPENSAGSAPRGDSLPIASRTKSPSTARSMSPPDDIAPGIRSMSSDPPMGVSERTMPRLTDILHSLRRMAFIHSRKALPSRQSDARRTAVSKVRNTRSSDVMRSWQSDMASANSGSWHVPTSRAAPWSGSRRMSLKRLLASASMSSTA